MPAARARRAHPASTFALVVGVLALVASGAAAAYLARNRPGAPGDESGGQPTPSASASVSAPASPTAGTSPAAARMYAAKGPNTYLFAKGQSEVFGTAGPLRTYRVAIETATPVPIDEFAGLVDATLSDPRSWIAGRNVRLQRVSGDSGGYSFTVYLVTPGTAQSICLAGGYDIFWRGEPYTSCRIGGRVLINIARYLFSVPNYGAPLAAYQQYAINHEVGHVLGHGHELCPGKGKPAPVMQQQTFDLQGCLAYFWPYRGGKRYAGPPGRIVPPG